ncbi:Mu transposase C-terminal domain-containing protein [Jannaschia aquimarina]|uniref:Integrase catalytic domain-containing protein n=1 Tax=Jannaschia aquimarina TaxID=935700 RepID=A0A0D1ECX0_9RHOB|nr:Mu transposase C-terminal domain-containing protein [Jannaschia aquimarina]KIT14776.1 hypothetical protein jaqu_35140 [Jannaschia aquimarina]SNT42423.1 putative transposase [Jannaschia aquimarina]
MTSKKPDLATSLTNRPLDDPLTDSLAAFSDAARGTAMERFRILQPHLDTDVPLTEVARVSGHSIRTLRRWLTRYHDAGLVGLMRRGRSDAGHRKLHADLAHRIEALAVQKPRLSAASIQRRIAEVARADGHPAPSYATVRRVMGALDPAMLCLVHEGPTAYRDRFELIHRHRAERPNAVWQADHTQLDLLILDANGEPARPWLTIVQDDYSRAVAGYSVFLGTPSALQTALALRQAIWRKTAPDWPVCGIPGTLYTDHGSDFTSQHLEQVAAELRIELVFSAVARPQGRGKIERIFGTVNTELLPELSGHLAEGKTRRPPALSLSELDQAVGRFLVGTHNARRHSEIGMTPNAAWRGDGWLPNLPESVEALDLLLLTVAKARLVRRDGIHFQGLRYMDPTLAAFVGEHVTIRYDPRDMAEIRVFHRNRFLCRAISPDHAGRTISLKDIQQARTARRRALRQEIKGRTGSVTDHLSDADHEPRPKPSAKSKLLLYKEDRRT